jgi:hypothetical protein
MLQAFVVVGSYSSFRMSRPQGLSKKTLEVLTNVPGPAGRFDQVCDSNSQRCFAAF